MRQNAEFSKLALSLHFIYLVTTCIAFAIQLMKLRGEKPSTDMWSLEQKYEYPIPLLCCFFSIFPMKTCIKSPPLLEILERSVTARSW